MEIFSIPLFIQNPYANMFDSFTDPFYLSLFLAFTDYNDSLSLLTTFNLNIQSTMVPICTTRWYSSSPNDSSNSH
jgi:hypothetical protein